MFFTLGSIDPEGWKQKLKSLSKAGVVTPDG